MSIIFFKFGSAIVVSTAPLAAFFGFTSCSIHTRIGSDGYPKGTYDSMDADGNLYLNGD